MKKSEGNWCWAVLVFISLQLLAEAQDCGVPPAITDGSVVAPSTLVGDEASYTCNWGFDMVGDAVITCEAGPAWSGGAPDCNQQDCGDPDPLTDGTVDITTTTIGSAATYACNPGYLQTGGVLTPQCVGGVNGASWTTGPPTCTIRDCWLPPQPALGTVTYTTTTYLSTATYTCNTGHTLVGDTTRTCTDQGAWSGSVPTCNINDCGGLKNPTDGVVSTTNTTYQSLATYSCATGYDLTGDTTRTCQASSAWSGTAPTCVIQDCGTPNAVDFATVSGDTTFGSAVTYVCIAGYVHNTGDLVRTCNTGPTWSGTLPTCRIQDCGTPDAVAFATVSGDTTFGSAVTYVCIAGYVHNTGDLVRTCNPGPTWSGTLPTCRIQDCGQPPTIANGAFTTPTGTTYNEQAIYTCNNGYNLPGEVPTLAVTCNDGPAWSAPPSCTILDCGQPPQPALGTVTVTTTTYLTTATYVCNTGHTLVGDTTRTCTDQGTWSGTLPTCNISDCGGLTNPTYGAMSTTTTTYQSVATYSCATGYDLTGDTTRTCQANSAWSGTAPTCVIQDCGTPDAVNFATVSGVTTFGSAVTYVCVAGYVHDTGDLVRACNPGPTWSGTLPTCRSQDQTKTTIGLSVALGIALLGVICLSAVVAYFLLCSSRHHTKGNINLALTQCQTTDGVGEYETSFDRNPTLDIASVVQEETSNH